VQQMRGKAAVTAVLAACCWLVLWREGEMPKGEDQVVHSMAASSSTVNNLVPPLCRHLTSMGQKGPTMHRLVMGGG